MSEEKKKWFTRNGSGMGFHPVSWQGWLILIGVVAVIICLIVLLKLHVL